MNLPARPIRVLSLGAGVQSTALLLMSIQGVLPKVDCAIFADTGWEPQGVYDHLQWLVLEARRADIPVHRVSRGNIRNDYLSAVVTGSKKRFVSLPVFLLNPDGTHAMLRRQCTREYKIEPIEKFIRYRLLGLRPGQRGPKTIVVEQWFGISWDESSRMKDSRVGWIRHVYPFCGKYGDSLLPEPLTRQDCMAWLDTHYPNRSVPRSACIGCPYHQKQEWERMRRDDPTSWQQAVEFDEQLRADSGLGDKLKATPFLHRLLLPLEIAVATAATVPADDERSWEGECDGMCGV